MARPPLSVADGCQRAIFGREPQTLCARSLQQVERPWRFPCRRDRRMATSQRRPSSPTLKSTIVDGKDLSRCCAVPSRIARASKCACGHGRRAIRTPQQQSLSSSAGGWPTLRPCCRSKTCAGVSCHPSATALLGVSRRIRKSQGAFGRQAELALLRADVAISALKSP